MASSKQLHRRMGRKRRLPKLNISDECTITSIDIEQHHHYNDDQQYGNISEIDSVDSTNDDKSSSLSTYHYNHNNNNIPHEHLLSDHTISIDVLILERDMKNVLTSLDKLGILEDDFKSLALATTSEEEKDDDCGDTWPTLSNYQEESKVETDDESSEENDWEVLSSADSVWSLASTGDTMSFRDALLQDATGSTMIASSVSHCIGGEPKIFSAPLALYTRPKIYQHNTASSDPVVNLEMLENADLWTSIRDAIKNLGARKEAFFTSGRS